MSQLSLGERCSAATMQATTVSSGAMTGSIRIGCSGWVYKHWRGILYPEGLPQRRWFDRYAEEFDTVEINNSFYRLPQAGDVRRVARAGAAGLLLCGEGQPLLTQAKKLKDCEEPLERMMAPSRQLGDRLGPDALPAAAEHEASTSSGLKTFLQSCPRDVDQRLRIPQAELVRAGDLRACSTATARPSASTTCRDRRRERIAVGPDRLRPLPRRRGQILGPLFGRRRCSAGPTGSSSRRAQGRAVWCYFNNDIHGHAIHDAQTLKHGRQAMRITSSCRA